MRRGPICRRTVGAGGVNQDRRRSSAFPHAITAKTAAIGRLLDFEQPVQRTARAKERQMNGQWIGPYTGSNSGLLVIDLDDMGTHYEGRAFVWHDNPSLPGTFVFIKTLDKAASRHLSLDLLPVNPRTGDVGSRDQIAPLFPPCVTFPRRAEVNLGWNGQTLKVDWKTDIGTFGVAELPKTRAGEPTEYQPMPDVTNWEQFKAYANALEHRRYIFRGQRYKLRL
jgi:hypothetical protein